jgi:hypothetical protein
MRKMSKKVTAVLLSMMMVFTLTISNVSAKTVFRYYEISAASTTYFKKKGRTLTVKTKKANPISYVKTNDYGKAKKTVRNKKFKLSKTCKYYLSSIGSGNKLYDFKSMKKKTSYSAIKKNIKYARRANDTFSFGVVFVVKKGTVRKVVMVLS